MTIKIASSFSTIESKLRKNLIMADISGTWLGTYWQQGIPTRFEATLVQSSTTLTGRILDDSYLGEAELTGEVIGRSVSFIKRYFMTYQDVIKYTGILSEDEDYMQGKWIIGRDSGQWEARRSGDALVADLRAILTKQVSLTK